MATYEPTSTSPRLGDCMLPIDKTKLDDQMNQAMITQPPPSSLLSLGSRTAFQSPTKTKHNKSTKND